ncbi:MAG: hypothetical protein OXF75_14085 [Acidimicrobiaceae bacterium]|nr:hypothetical protein [Acidimicrobiaceae bacterium]
MTTTERLVVLTSADSEELTATLFRSLSGWCNSGLLGEVVWLSAAELASEGYRAACWQNSDGGWSEGLLGPSMSRYHRQEVWLVALRHPKGPAHGVSVEQARRIEDSAHETLGELLGAGSKFRSLTVGVADACRPSAAVDCAPLWHHHLLHDCNVEAHELLPRTKAAGSEPLSLCAMVALSATGGWRGAPGGLAFAADRSSGPTKPVRFVHSQVRVLHTPTLVMAGSDMPLLPPWPLPRTAGVERAQPGEVPPLALARFLARKSGFMCRRPAVESASLQFGLRWTVGCLVRKINELAEQTASEEALGALADRSGGLHPERNGLSSLKLEGVATLADLVRHIERSNFPPLDDTPLGLGEIPDSWKIVRETMLGLVDGGPLSSEIAEQATGRSQDNSSRLVWTDPSGIAPAHAPADASDILPSLEYEREEESDPEAVETGGASDLEKSAEAHETDGSSEVDAPVSVGADDDNAREVDAVAQAGTDPSSEDRAEQDDAAGSATLPDTLMERLAFAIRHALVEAQREFTRHCVLVSQGTEHETARRAQKVVRWGLASLLSASMTVLLFAVDHRWPFLANSWELLTPFEARGSYDPTRWPIGWFLIGVLVLVVGAVLLWTPTRNLIECLERLERAEAERQRLAVGSAHYAAELLRLYGIAQQFSDHRLIITEFLYRPFGHAEDRGVETQRAEELAFDVAPPHSMLVAYAEAEPGKLDAVRRRQQESAAEPNWLGDAYQRVYKLWSDRYSGRIVGDFKGPDHDTSERGTVVHRDRHDGSPIEGARSDFAHSVIWHSQSDGSGWALRQGANRMTSLQDSSTERDDLLELLDSLQPVHGSQPTIDAEEFFEFAQVSHRFTWDALLKDGANPPDDEQTLTERYALGDAGKGRSLILAYQLAVSGPVQPHDQAHWAAELPEQPSDASESVV